MLTESIIHTTAEGDRLDQLCARYYDGDTSMLPAVLAANSHLSAQPPEMPSGIAITFPPGTQPRLQKRRLWDA